MNTNFKYLVTKEEAVELTTKIGEAAAKHTRVYLVVEFKRDQQNLVEDLRLLLYRRMQEGGMVMFCDKNSIKIYKNKDLVTAILMVGLEPEKVKGLEATQVIYV